MSCDTIAARPSLAATNIGVNPFVVARLMLQQAAMRRATIGACQFQAALKKGRASMFVSVVDVGICAFRRQKRLGCQRIATGIGFKQLGAVAVLFSSISTSTI